MPRPSSLVALLLVLVPFGVARADEPPAPPAAQSTESPSTAPKSTEPLPAPSPPEAPPPAPDKPAAEKPPEPEKPAEKPYTEGWHAGTPPGDHFHLWVDYWIADLRRGPEYEFDHDGRRVGVLRTRSLGYGTTQPVFSTGGELDAGDYGWYSVDYWQLVLGGRAHQIGDGNHLFVDSLFPDGDVVHSHVEEHFAKLRDGVDCRYRVPLGEDTFFDLNFGPVLGLGFRYENVDVRSALPALNDGSHFFALTVLPGVRVGGDLHLPAHVTVRAAADVDWLPDLGHANYLSLTREPSVTEWHDVHVYLAVRAWFFELTAGYRYFEAFSGRHDAPGGGRLRVGNAFMRGLDFGASVAF